MASTTLVIKHASLKMCSLQAWYLALFNPFLNMPKFRLQATYKLASQLQCWITLANLLTGRPFALLVLTSWITTDASLVGWGAHCGDLQVHAMWSPKEKLLHIINLELLAIFKVFCAFLPVIAGTALQVTMDNTTARYYINKQGGTHLLPLLYLAVQFWEWCLEHHFSSAVHISTQDNVWVDHLSRRMHKWSLNHNVLLSICK